MFDNGYASDEEFQHLENTRAENQPWYVQAAASITKGTLLAGTTFVDGTVGLLLGIC